MKGKILCPAGCQNPLSRITEAKENLKSPRSAGKAGPLFDASPEEQAVLTDRQMINRLQREVAYLHQEIEFLKKVSAVDQPEKQRR